MLTLYNSIFTLFASIKFFIFKHFRDFILNYENILQTKCKQFRMFSYLCKFVKSLKVLILRVFTTAIFVLFPTSTCLGCFNIIAIYGIYNIIVISTLCRYGNINIYNIYCISCIIFFYILWTNRGHCPHLLTFSN